MNGENNEKYIFNGEHFGVKSKADANETPWESIRRIPAKTSSNNGDGTYAGLL